jgi:hypothetical protein
MKSITSIARRTSNGLRSAIRPILAITALAMLMALVASATPVSAGRAAPAATATPSNCLKDLYGKNVQCTANDVSVAYADNPRDLDGNSLTGAGKGCQAGQPFSFIADFHIVTTSTARENIGLYFQTAGGSSALTGTCSDNIISPLHFPNDAGTPSIPPLGDPGNECIQNGGTKLCYGSALYHEYDTSLTGPPADNCGDTTSADGTSQVITVEVDNALCVAGTNALLKLPNCTS